MSGSAGGWYDAMRSPEIEGNKFGNGEYQNYYYSMPNHKSSDVDEDRDSDDADDADDDDGGDGGSDGAGGGDENLNSYEAPSQHAAASTVHSAAAPGLSQSVSNLAGNAAGGRGDAGVGKLARAIPALPKREFMKSHSPQALSASVRLAAARIRHAGGGAATNIPLRSEYTTRARLTESVAAAVSKMYPPPSQLPLSRKMNNTAAATSASSGEAASNMSMDDTSPEPDSPPPPTPTAAKSPKTAFTFSAANGGGSGTDSAFDSPLATPQTKQSAARAFSDPISRSKKSRTRKSQFTKPKHSKTKSKAKQIIAAGGAAMSDLNESYRESAHELEGGADDEDAVADPGVDAKERFTSHSFGAGKETATGASASSAASVESPASDENSASNGVPAVEPKAIKMKAKYCENRKLMLAAHALRARAPHACRSDDGDDEDRFGDTEDMTEPEKAKFYKLRYQHKRYIKEKLAALELLCPNKKVAVLFVTKNAHKARGYDIDFYAPKPEDKSKAKASSGEGSAAPLDEWWRAQKERLTAIVEASQWKQKLRAAVSGPR